MSPFFLPGDRLLLLRAKRFRYGDAIVFRDDRRSYLKRIAGLPGDTVTCWGQPFELGEDEYYALGDNRDRSRDSRHFGPIRSSQIVGRVVLKYFPKLEFVGRSPVTKD